MSKNTPITVAYGDGIGPEIMQAVLHILMKAEAKISIEVIKVGEKLYKKNYTSGIAPNTWESIERIVPVGSLVHGTVTKTTAFGAFVQLENGIDIYELAVEAQKAELNF